MYRQICPFLTKGRNSKIVISSNDNILTILSEIWGNPDTAKLNIVECYSHAYDARQRRIGGGVSIYIDLRIPYRIRSDLKLDHTIFESIFIEVDNQFLTANTMLSWLQFISHQMVIQIFLTNISKKCLLPFKGRENMHF